MDALDRHIQRLRRLPGQVERARARVAQLEATARREGIPLPRPNEGRA